MKLEVHLLSHDGEQMLRWSLRHYARFAHRIVVHDGGPTGVSKKTATLFCGAVPGGVDVEVWDTAGQLNDELAMRLKNSCWRGTDADWVAVMDADELLHFPDGVEETLAAYERIGAAVARPHGFEMFSDEWFDPEVFEETQITDLAPDGAPDDVWYAKPVLFSPRRVAESGLGVGAHESDPVLKNGLRFHVGRNWPFADPPVYLLHYKSIFGGVDRIAERYDATRRRLAAVNERNGWGNFKPGRDHALEKRAALLPNVRRVVRVWE